MTQSPIQTAIATVARGRDLDAAAMQAAMHQIMAGEATPAQIAGLLVGLSVKGETVEEIVGFAEAMRARSIRVPVEDAGTLLDICGTGGTGERSAPGAGQLAR